MFKIHLSESVSSNFRKTINDFVDLSINHTYMYKNRRLEKSWNSICSIMDRVDDLVIYLNQKELDNGVWKNCAFDFFEFIEQAGVLVSCIDQAFNIYGVNQPEHGIIFKSKRINNNNLSLKNINNLDNQYFKYIRSLSSVHPDDTSFHRDFQEASFEVSPYVVWNKGAFRLNNPDVDLVITTYNNETDDFLVNKGIYIDELFNFIKFKYYSLNYLSMKIKLYYNSVIRDFRCNKIKKEREFNNYILYLENLKCEATKRNPNMESEIQDLIDIFNLKLTNNTNNEKFNKYKNSLQYAAHSYYRQLQNMDFNCISPFDHLVNDLLIGKIYDKDDNYHYPLSKILYLKDDLSDCFFAIRMYNSLLKIFQRYIDISEDDLNCISHYELFVLAQIALYFHALENKSVVSSFIPQTSKYR